MQHLKPKGKLEIFIVILGCSGIFLSILLPLWGKELISALSGLVGSGVLLAFVGRKLWLELRN